MAVVKVKGHWKRVNGKKVWVKGYTKFNPMKVYNYTVTKGGKNESGRVIGFYRNEAINKVKAKHKGSKIKKLKWTGTVGGVA